MVLLNFVMSWWWFVVSKQKTYVAVCTSEPQCLYSSNSSTSPLRLRLIVHTTTTCTSYRIRLPLPFDPSFCCSSQLPCLLTSDDADVDDDEVDVLNLLLLFAAPTPVKRCLRCVCKIRIKQSRKDVLKQCIISNLLQHGNLLCLPINSEK